MNYLKKILKEYKKSKAFIDQYSWKEIHLKKSGKSLNQIINQFLLIFCMY